MAASGIYKWGLGIAFGIVLIFGGMKHSLIEAAAVGLIVCAIPFLPALLAESFVDEVAVAVLYVSIAIVFALVAITQDRWSWEGSDEICEEYGPYGVEVCKDAHP